MRRGRGGKVEVGQGPFFIGWSREIRRAGDKARESGWANLSKHVCSQPGQEASPSPSSPPSQAGSTRAAGARPSDTLLASKPATLGRTNWVLVPGSLLEDKLGR